MQDFIIRWRRPRKVSLLPELNTYPETPEGFLSGFYPGSKRVGGFKVSFDIKLQTLPELNTYPLTITNQYPGWLVRPTKKVKTRFSLQSLPELNEYRQVGFPYPSWLEKKAHKIRFRRNHLTTRELNVYPQIVLSPALLPAFIAQKQFRSKHRVRDVEHALFAFVAPAVPVSIPIGTRYNIDFFPDDRNITFETDERAITFNAEDREILL